MSGMAQVSIMQWAAMNGRHERRRKKTGVGEHKREQADGSGCSSVITLTRSRSSCAWSVWAPRGAPLPSRGGGSRSASAASAQLHSEFRSRVCNCNWREQERKSSERSTSKKELAFGLRDSEPEGVTNSVSTMMLVSLTPFSASTSSAFRSMYTFSLSARAVQPRFSQIHTRIIILGSLRTLS